MIALNKKALYEYFVLDVYEAGIVLCGSEVKSVSLGNISLSESFCQIEKGEVWLKNCYIKPYEKGSYFNKEERRNRKLLLNRSEINKLTRAVKEQSVTIIPLKAYFKNGKLKVEIALAKGKKTYDKKQAIKERDILRSYELKN